VYYQYKKCYNATIYSPSFMDILDSAPGTDTDRMDAEFENKCRTWINAYRLQNGDSATAILRHVALSDFIDCVADHIRTKRDDPWHRHDAVVQAKATIEHIETHQKARSVLISEFYYGLVMKLLDEQYGNSKFRSDIDDGIAEVRRNLRGVF
jgi:hypothetical protein